MSEHNRYTVDAAMQIADAIKERAKALNNIASQIGRPIDAAEKLIEIAKQKE